jgi:hypothetical protein
MATPARNSRVLYRAHLRAVVGDRQQRWDDPPTGQLAHRVAVAVEQCLAQRVGGAGVGGVEQVLGCQGGGDGHLDLDRGLLGADQGGDLLAGHHVDDGQRGAARGGEVGEVIGPDPVGFPPQPVRPRRPRPWLLWG